MKWLFWRRKRQPDAPVVMERTAAVERVRPHSAPLRVPVALRDELLTLARDVLVAAGARVRVEAADVVTAMLADGTRRRYTTTLARARDEEGTELLVVGGAALDSLLAEVARHARVTALRLPATADPLVLARQACAEPVSGCAQCVGGEAGPRCERCPARGGSYVVPGAGRMGKSEELRRWLAWQVELSYRVAYRDRRGRSEEWLRIGVHADGAARLDPLDEAALARAEPADVPPEAAMLLQAAEKAAAAEIGPALAAAGAFARLRSEADYRQRLDDIDMTYRRLAREEPRSRAALASAQEREVERLCEVFAVDVEAHLASVCFIATTLAEVELRPARGPAVHLVVDLGRAMVRPPESVSVAASRGALMAVQSSHGDTQQAQLTIEQLDALTPGMWVAFASWLWERDGVRVERVEHNASHVVMHGSGPTGEAMAVAQRLEYGWALGEAEVKQAAALCSASAGAKVFISTAQASAQACAAADRLGIGLIDRGVLAERLSALARAYDDKRGGALREAEARAAAASRARERLVAALRCAEEALAAAPNPRRATGLGIPEAVVSITRSRQAAARALLAWETVIGEWSSGFAEREARDGSLIITANQSRLNEIAERATHLGAALHLCCDEFAGTPGAGAFGYGTWRKAVLEELTASCEALRWRALALDPAQWQDFAVAHDDKALERAEAATTNAAHARARATKAYAQLATRVRLPASSGSLRQ